MNALLICPDPRPGVLELAEFAPLAALPFLGESLLEYWLTHLAGSGVKRVKILAHDRPDHIAALAGDGARWGLEIQVLNEARELTPVQAQLKYSNIGVEYLNRAGRSLVLPRRRRNPAAPSGREQSAADQEAQAPLPVADWAADSVTVLDHLPGFPNSSLFGSYTRYFSALLKWLPKAKTPERVGIRQIRPGVWVGAHSRVSPAADLRAPCWIGKGAYVGARAVLGPKTILEDRAFVEPEAEIGCSVIGPDTFVGRLAAVHDSFAWGNTLVHWKSGVCTHVQDAFLLCALRQTMSAPADGGFVARLAERYTGKEDEIQILWRYLLRKLKGV